MRLTILDGHAVNPGDLDWEAFKALAEVTVFERTPQDQVIDHIGSAEAVFLNKISITEEILSKCPSLRYIGVLATGYNVIDLEACRRHGVTVTNIPKYSTDAVAQHVFAFILNFTNQVYQHNESVQKGDWIKCKDFCYWNDALIELSGKTLGILGFGSIGQKVAQIAEAFGMRVLYTTRTPRQALPGVNAPAPVPLQKLFSQSDFISLHAPLTDQTKDIVNERTISLMKKTACLINTARGGFIDEDALAIALKNGRIAGYAADVVKEEPMRRDNPLLGCPNCFITPHIAWAPRETRRRLQGIALDNLKAWISGNPINVVS